MILAAEMGVKDFYKITRTKDDKTKVTIDSLGVEINLDGLAGKRICIDGNNLIYASMTALRFVEALTDAEGNPTAHINTTIQQVLGLRQKGVDQLWLFDNPKPTEMKAAEVARRKAIRKPDRFEMTPEIMQEAILLLQYMGVPYIIAPYGIEAEKYGALLCQGGFCYAMLSADSDVLMFGGCRQIKPTSVKRGKSKKKIYKLFELNTVLEGMAIDYHQLVVAGVILGCDFAPKTDRIGPRTVLSKLDTPLTEQQQEGYNYFTSDITMDLKHLQMPVAQPEALQELLIGKGFNPDRVEKILSTFK